MEPDVESWSRYQRQMLLSGIGAEGQRCLAGGHVLVVGCGALGCGVADHLARAGVGTLTIIDRDVVEATNLQRQVLFDERHVAAGLPKAEAARSRLREINSAVRVVAHVADLSARTARLLVPEPGGPDVIVDGADNFETRLLVNDLSQSRGIPYVYAGVLGTRGIVMPVVPSGAGAAGAGGGGGGPCLRCLFERPPLPGSVPTCETAGVLGPTVGVATGLQAAEAIKLLVGAWGSVSGELVEFDLWSGVHRRIAAGGMRDPGCACCVGRDFAYLEGRAGAASTVLCGRGSVQITPGAGERAGVDLSALARRLEPAGSVTVNPFLVRVELVGERGDAAGAAAAGVVTITVFRDGRAIVAGTTRMERARSLYDRYVGG